MRLESLLVKAVSVLVAVGALLVVVLGKHDGLPAWMGGSSGSEASGVGSSGRGPGQRLPVATLKVFPDTMPMFVNPDDQVITPILLRDGLWEQQETHWILRNLAEGDTFLDIGANAGYYTLIAARVVGESGRVFAFEPDPVSFSILEQNVRMHERPNVVLEQKAVSNEAGTLELHLSEQNKGDHRIYETEESRSVVTVEAVALDSYLAETPGRVDFAKIDTQGAEAVILAGMDGVIRRNDQIRMAVEFWPFGLSGLGSTAEDLLQILESHDFALFDLGSGAEAGVTDELPLRTPEELLKQHTVENETYTNLLVAKGRDEIARLVREVEATEAKLRLSPESHQARETHETAVVALRTFKARLTGGGASSPREGSRDTAPR